jgi:two-component system chemotaxis sensor kinase CheA
MVDIKKLQGVFVEEAMERLSELEEGLLRLEKSPQDKDLINTIFRAAHTIKGSSGTVGLKDISAFTHHMEEVLDMVRQDKLAPDKDLISSMLEATDMIKEMVEAVSADAVFDFARCGDLIKRMEAIKGAEPAAEKQTEAVDEGVGPEKLFMIKFTPSQDLFKRGIDPGLIIEDLKTIGEIIDIKGYTDYVPALSEMDYESLYLRWDIQIKTNAAPQKIKEIFAFVEDGDVKIMPLSAPKERASLLGQMLVEEGIVKPGDIRDALKEQKRLGEILVEQGKAGKDDIERIASRQAQKKSETIKTAATSSIRVDLKKLDHLINTVGEMVIIHSMLQQAIHGNGGSGVVEKLDAVFSQLQRIGKEIQESAMSLRMLPVGEVFNRFTRLVRELSASKAKKIEMIITGEDTELDKGVLEKITDPLVHLIRNSIDHGIETPEERVSAGKPAYGTIHLSAYQMGDSVYIDVKDDGKGLNKEKIVEKAVSKGIISGAKDMSDEQIFNLIFLPGFSTADKITDVSGRGVGMDVVRKNIEALNGKVYLRSEYSKGTTTSIKLPLTLAIIDGLTVLVGDEVFVIPITSVVESLRPRMQDVKTVSEKGEVVNVRGEYIPLIRLYEKLGVEPWKRDPWEAIVILVSHENGKYCVLVDELLGEQQIVIKNLGAAMPKLPDIAGGTILGDGKVALVLDVPGLVETTIKEAVIA